MSIQNSAAGTGICLYSNVTDASIGGVHIYLFWVVSLFVLGHELGVELDDALHPVGSRGQEGRTEVQRVLLLTEARARHDTDTRGVQETEAVELVSGAVLGLGGLDRLGREGDRGEEVHGTLY